MVEHGPLCVGVDPHPALLTEWGLEDSAAGLSRFSDAVIEAATGRCAAVKPNAAFYERHGSAGIAVLERLLADCRDRGLLTILDAKRGDIGSTMRAYAEAFLVPGAPLEADSLTVSPYLGFGSLAPALDLAAEHGKGLFVLALTSNPEGAAVQHAIGTDGVPVARAIAAAAAAINAGQTPMGSVGLVVGATVGDAVSRLGIDLSAVNGPLLAPGVGAQGATPADVATVFGDARPTVLVNQSRGVLNAGPYAESLNSAILKAADAARADVGGPR